MSGNNSLASTWYLKNCCATDKIVSLGPKRSIEINISKISCFHDDKRLWPEFRGLNECDKAQRTFYKGP